MSLDLFSDLEELAKGFVSGFDKVVDAVTSDSALWDVATGAAVGAGIAWATDNDIALGAGIGAGAGFLTSSGGYEIPILSKFDLTDMLLGTGTQGLLGTGSPSDTATGIPMASAANKLPTDVPGPPVAEAVEGSKGLLQKGLDFAGTKVGSSAVAGVAGYLTKQEELDQLRELERERERRLDERNQITSTGTSGRSNLLPSALKSTGTFLASRR